MGSKGNRFAPADARERSNLVENQANPRKSEGKLTRDRVEKRKCEKEEKEEVSPFRLF